MLSRSTGRRRPGDGDRTAGWTSVIDQRAGRGADTFHALVFSHIATSDEPGEYSFGVADGVYVDIQIAAYSGVSTVDAVAGASAGSARAISAPSVVTSADGRAVVAVYIDVVFGACSTADGLTQRRDFDCNSLQDAMMATAGATPALRAVNASRGGLAAITVAVR